MSLVALFLIFRTASGQEMSAEDCVLTERHVSAERKLLYLFGNCECWCSVKLTLPVCSYNWHCSRDFTVKDHDNLWTINTKSCTGR